MGVIIKIKEPIIYEDKKIWKAVMYIENPDGSLKAVSSFGSLYEDFADQWAKVQAQENPGAQIINDNLSGP